MPYVKKDQRETVDPAVDALAEAVKKATVYTGMANRPVLPDGALNYAITTLLQKTVCPSNYVEFERVIGILECAKLEFYRRAVAPYENVKAKENGDVFEWREGGQL